MQAIIVLYDRQNLDLQPLLTRCPGLHAPAAQCSDSVHRRVLCVQVAVEVARSALSVFMCNKNTSVYMGTEMQKRRNARWAVGLFTLLPWVLCVADIVAGC